MKDQQALEVADVRGQGNKLVRVDGEGLEVDKCADVQWELCEHVIVKVQAS